LFKIGICDAAAVLSYAHEVDLPENVPQPLIRKARKGNVRPLNAGYLADAAYTPAPPRASPIAPPMEPPLIVAL
jgi:hypothetical protein